ncbi:MAG: hypothetical protein JJT82_09785 [Legionellaceae bacterium]|nr:hypothetical protein [Legionellaceae bacterium]
MRKLLILLAACSLTLGLTACGDPAERKDEHRAEQVTDDGRKLDAAVDGTHQQLNEGAAPATPPAHDSGSAHDGVDTGVDTGADAGTHTQ